MNVPVSIVIKLLPEITYKAAGMLIRGTVIKYVDLFLSNFKTKSQSPE